MNRFAALCIALLGILHLGSASAIAQPTLRCGTVITSWVTLGADLSCPSGHGLVLTGGALLDCNGHRITGGNAPEQYGIYLRDAADALVRNCAVEQFEVGIRLRGARNVVIEDTTTRNNTRYGMELTQASVGAVLQRNMVLGNGDEGIHISGPTDVAAGHQILRNTLDGNRLEGIYLLRTSGNLIADNTIQNHGAAGIYVKQSNHNTLSGNTLINDPLQLVSASAGNLVKDNTIIGQAIKLNQASSNEVHNLTVLMRAGRPSVAYDLTRSSNNLIVDSASSNPPDYDIRAVSASRNNVFTRFTAPPRLSCSVDRTSSVRVSDQSGLALPCGQ